MRSKLFLQIGLNIQARVLAFLVTVAMAISSSPAQTSAPPATASPGERIEGFTDTPMLPGDKWHQHDPNRPQPPVVTPGATFN